MRLRRAALLLSLSVAALALLPASASADNDDFACQAMPTNHALKKVFDLPHVIVAKNPGGGTDDELGAFTSSCFGYLYKKKALPGVNPFGLPPSLKVRKGFAKLHVSVTFQQEGPEGENWDPDAIRQLLLTGIEAQVEADHGHLLELPALGSTFVQGLTFATEADNADGIWQDGVDSIVVVDIQSHGSAAEHLKKLAPPVVYSAEAAP